MGLTAVITGGTLVFPWGTMPGGLAIQEGRIAALLAPGEIPPASQVIDARGHLIFPGLVDVHTHLRDPGQTHKEDFASGTAAAAAGGFTMVVAQPNTVPPILDPDSFRLTRDRGERLAIVDFSVTALATPRNLSELAALAKLGAASFEVLLADAPPELLSASSDDVSRVLLAIAAAGGLAGVYAEEASVVAGLRAEETGNDLAAFLRTRPAFTEALAVARVLELVRATRVRAHLRQISTGAAVQALRRAKAAFTLPAALASQTHLAPQAGLTPRAGLVSGAQIAQARLTVEVNPHHLFLTADDLPRLGPYGLVLPALRGRADQEGLWAGIANGTVDLIATDHAPHTREEKEAGRNSVWQAPCGVPGLETALPLCLTAVRRGQLGLPDVARLLAWAPSRRFGFFPRKGALLPGADADVVIADPDRVIEVRGEALHSRARQTPFEGWTLYGAPVLTMVRGRIVYEEGKVTGEPGWGRFVAPSQEAPG
ncbi:MAG: dihydroorotase family protein [Deltaproteobacteria bacterium]|nr:dihydroorotase family protein [Deltaproteobacteria bacterium]